MRGEICFLIYFMAFILPVSVRAKCYANDSDFENRWQGLTNLPNSNQMIEIYVGILGNSKGDSCHVAHWMFPDDNVNLVRSGSFSSEIDLPKEGPAMVICSLHSAITYANSISLDINVYIYIARGIYHIGYHGSGSLPQLERSMHLIGAKKDGSISNAFNEKELTSLISFTCSNEVSSIEGGYDMKPKYSKSSYKNKASSTISTTNDDEEKENELIVGIKYHLQTVLKGGHKDSYGNEGLLKVISGNGKITISNIAFIGGVSERGGGLFILNDQNAEIAADNGALQLGRLPLSSSSPSSSSSSSSSFIPTPFLSLSDSLISIFKLFNPFDLSTPHYFTSTSNDNFNNGGSGETRRKMLLEAGGLEVVDLMRRKMMQENDERNVVHLNNCDFLGNVAYYGGAIYSGAGLVKLTNCHLTGNSAKMCGGALYAVHGFAETSMELTAGMLNSDRCASPSSTLYDPMYWVPRLPSDSDKPSSPLAQAYRQPGSSEAYPLLPSGDDFGDFSDSDGGGSSGESGDDAGGFLGMGDPITDLWVMSSSPDLSLDIRRNNYKFNHHQRSKNKAKNTKVNEISSIQSVLRWFGYLLGLLIENCFEFLLPNLLLNKIRSFFQIITMPVFIIICVIIYYINLYKMRLLFKLYLLLDQIIKQHAMKNNENEDSCIKAELMAKTRRGGKSQKGSKDKKKSK